MTPRRLTLLHRVDGSRRASTETAETITGRPWRAGLRRSEVDLGHSDHVRPDQTGSDRIGPDQTGSNQTDPETAEVEPVDCHGVPDYRGYSSVDELQPTWTR